MSLNSHPSGVGDKHEYDAETSTAYVTITMEGPHNKRNATEVAILLVSILKINKNSLHNSYAVGKNVRVILARPRNVRGSFLIH